MRVQLADGAEGRALAEGAVYRFGHFWRFFVRVVEWWIRSRAQREWATRTVSGVEVDETKDGRKL